MTIRNQRYIISETNGALPVNVQDQTTLSVILPLTQKLAETTLALGTSVNDTSITVTSSTGFVIGKRARIIGVTSQWAVCVRVLNIVGNVLTIDTPLDFAFTAGDIVVAGNGNMAVDGSVTPVEFSLRAASTSIEASIDITRLMFSCQTVSAVNLDLFGDLPALTNGIFLRRDINSYGLYHNVFNVKSNLDIASIMYDFTVFQASNPAQGVDGFSGRLTFAGQNKIGVVLRIPQGDNLKLIVQDDLTGLTDLRIIAEGHLVQD